MIKETY